MDDWLKILITALAGYLIGSVNFAIIVSRLTIKADIRDFGSGNAGSTNAYRTLGPRIAIPVILGDIAKGVAAVLLGWFIMGDLGRLIAGTFAVFGHAFPIYFGFRGGKGVMTTAAIMLVIDWRVALIAISIFAVLAVLTRYISLGSIIAAASLPFTSWFFYHDHQDFAFYLVMSIVFAIAIILLHRENAMRLIKGQESKFSFKRKKN